MRFKFTLEDGTVETVHGLDEKSARFNCSVRANKLITSAEFIPSDADKQLIDTLKHAWTPCFHMPHWRLQYMALSDTALAVCCVDIEHYEWRVYIDGVLGLNHIADQQLVARDGSKASEKLGRILFPILENIPWAR